MESLKKSAQPLFLIVLVLAILILLKGFLIPFAYGLLIALIIYPASLAIFLSILMRLFPLQPFCLEA